MLAQGQSHALMAEREVRLMQQLHEASSNTPLLPWGEGEGQVRFENTCSGWARPDELHSVMKYEAIQPSECTSYPQNWLLPMPKYNGGTLRDYIGDETITEQKALQVVRQIGNALQELHRPPIGHGGG